MQCRTQRHQPNECQPREVNLNGATLSGTDLNGAELTGWLPPIAFEPFIRISPRRL
ncbi:MAG: pentapeptide repeat-containing protein [Leptolyngbyaceae cyanobacterium]